MTPTEPTKSILHIGNFLSGHGNNRQFVEDLADRMQDGGWYVRRSSTAVSRPLRLGHMLAAVWQSRSSVSVGHITVFSGLAFGWAEAAALMFRLVGVPYVLSLHGGNLPAFARRWPGRVRRLLSGARAVTAPSGFLLEKLCAFRADIRVIPNPVSISHLAYRPRPSPRPILVWLRAFHAIYDPQQAVRVLSMMRTQFPAARLIMAGPDKGDGSLAACRRLVDDLGLANSVEIGGPLPKARVPDFLERGDIFLNTAATDNTPISVLEAMASGLCIVSTNVGGLPYLLHDGQSALLTPAHDPEAMAGAVCRILTEPGLAERLAAQARAQATQFDWPNVLPRWQELFLSVAGER